MFSPISFNIGDLVIQQLSDLKDPTVKISRRGIISEVAVSTIVVKWSKDSEYSIMSGNEVRMLTSTARRMILNGSLQHFPSKK